MTKWIDVLWGGGLTQSGIKPASSKDLRSHISIMSVAVQRCVDGGVSKRLSFVPGHLRDGSLHVSVGPGYDNVELVAILTLVEGIRRLNITAPEDTHNDCSGRGVFTTCAGLLGRAALKEDVDPEAAIDVVAIGGALRRVVGAQGGHAHVPVRAGAGMKVLEGVRVPRRSSRPIRGRGECAIR